MMGIKTVFYFVVLSVLDYNAICQDSLHHLNITTALKIAEQNYPLLKAKKYEFEAASRNVDLSKNTILPSLDISYQANLATANNITGQFYPSEMIPMTGPVFTGNNYNPAFGSAASLLLNWEPFTFGSRTAKINSSKSAIKSSKSRSILFPCSELILCL